MQIAIDGASKRNGQPTCLAVGVAWIETADGNLLFKSKAETESTNQRGEIYGLLEALKYAVENAADDETIVIITDSEYIFNTVSKRWCYTWKSNGWKTSSGDTAKNADQWELACHYLTRLNMREERVFMQWTKGHIFSYTKGNIKVAMETDPTGVELYERISTMASKPAQVPVIASRFNNERKEHGHLVVPEETAVEWVIFNSTADSIASYIAELMDASYPL